MGEKLMQLFEKAAEKGGGDLAKARLAMKSQISEATAKTAADTPENIKKLQDAIDELWG